MDSNRLVKKKSIKLSGKILSQEEVSILIDVLQNTEVLEELHIRYCSGPDFWPNLFADGLAKNSSLINLELERDDIGDEGGVILAEMLKSNSTLEIISLAQIQLGEEDAKSIFAAIKVNRTLKEVLLFDCGIDDSGAASFAECLGRNQTLESVSLGNNNITCHGLKSISEGLMANGSLQWIFLSQNNIGDFGARSLAASLRKNTSLRTIILEDCKINDKGGLDLAEALNHNTQIRKIRLFGNPMSDKMRGKINSVLSDSKRQKAAAAPTSRLDESLVMTKQNPSSNCPEARGGNVRYALQQRRSCLSGVRRQYDGSIINDSNVIDLANDSESDNSEYASPARSAMKEDAKKKKRKHERPPQCHQPSCRPRPAERPNLAMTAATISSNSSNEPYASQGPIGNGNGRQEVKQQRIISKPASTQSPFEIIKMQLDHIEVNSSDTKKENAKLLTEKADAEKRAESLGKCIKKLDDEKTQLGKKCDCLQRDIDSKNACIDNLRVKSRSLEVELSLAKEDSASKDAEIKKLMRENLAMQEKLKHLNELVTKNETEIISLNNRLSLKEEDVATLPADSNMNQLEQITDVSVSNMNNSNQLLTKVEVKEEM